MNRLDKFREMQEYLGGSGLVETLLWSFALVGGLFIIYSFVIFIQIYIRVKFRFALSILFFLIGTLFLNLTGRIITGYYEHFTVVTIINTCILAILGAIFVWIVYYDNKKGRHEYKNRKNKKL